ncbi:MAG: DUF1376 domain-containing protein [Gallionella sp.]|nr:DUF1376 domain-containing protein [Gallionella sp.]
MSKTDAWLPLYVADYLAATTRLTTEQHGAYLLIIMDYWRNGAPPDDDVVLAQVTRMTLARWKAQRGVIERFFQVSGKCWQHKRINAEIERAKAKQKAKQEAGKLGGEAKAKALANSVANAKLKATPSPSPLPKTFTGTEKPSPAPSPEIKTEQSQNLSAAADAATAPRAKCGNVKAKSEAHTGETWTAYSSAYEERYHVLPMRNAKVNGMLARFCERIPLDEAPGVAAFFVRSNRGLYVNSRHAVDLLLRDAEGLRTEWATGHHGTETEAHQADKTAATGNVFGKLIAEADEAEKLAANLVSQ